MRLVNILQDGYVIKDRHSHRKQIAKIVYVMGVRMNASLTYSEASEVATTYAVDVSSIRLRELLTILVEDGHVKEEDIPNIVNKLQEQMTTDIPLVTEEFEILTQNSQQLSKALTEIGSKLPTSKIN